MHKKVLPLLTVAILIAPSTHLLANQSNETHKEAAAAAAPQHQIKPIANFTGKVTKNKVRMRQQPNIESPIIKELAKDELLIVTGESDDFYAVKPTHDLKAYVFRTYVLDNVVEGNHVNVRLEPNLESPVVVQLNSGDRVDGIISPLNSKWLEISIPEDTHFFVAKEYLDKVGDANYLSTLERRREEVNKLLNSTYLASQSELQKSYEEIDIDSSIDSLNKVIRNYTDFPEQVARAKELLNLLQDTYLQKKITYLESKAQPGSPQQILSTAKDAQRMAELNDQQNRFEKLQQTQKPMPIEHQAEVAPPSVVTNAPVAPMTPPANVNKNLPLARLSVWMPVEQAIYECWLEENGQVTQEEFYEKQKETATMIKGIVEPYTRNIKNKPGDYVLLNSSRTPVAYLYSTQVDLQPFVGMEVTVSGVSRPNNHFAFPAYFVLSVD